VKKTGPGDVSLMVIAIATKSGAKNSSARLDDAASKSLFLLDRDGSLRAPR
jgi:hypothetical protein